ncbi:hypothetical protein K431DRAFT_234095 [Polychaeton citri CBS 116435]|uniref:50S ribosomal protein YmL27 n=1 Tax=Polychaeton citri CBS 116435 TaxID=1314669 RepID=A0A9P4UL56_9PEZI|nr:hypothetical protein K431DRAFT_234095 [Polychaeton citri CBS 116435]
MRPSPTLQRAVRRLPLSTKQAGKDFYKGTGTGSMGWHTKHGGYKIDWNKVRTYVCPDLTDFHLTPFVLNRIKVRRDTFTHTESRSAVDGREYLKKWKEEGGNI